MKKKFLKIMSCAISAIIAVSAIPINASAVESTVVISGSRVYDRDSYSGYSLTSVFISDSDKDMPSKGYIEEVVPSEEYSDDGIFYHVNLDEGDIITVNYKFTNIPDYYVDYYNKNGVYSCSSIGIMYGFFEKTDHDYGNLSGSISLVHEEKEEKNDYRIYSEDIIEPGLVLNYEIVITPASKFESPENVTAVSGGGNATITWDAVSDATSYRVFRSDSLTGTRTLEKVRTSTYYIDTNVDTGKTYYYWIVAYNANTGLKSDYSACSSVKIVDTFAKSIEIKSASVLSTAVTLKWDMVPGATSYRIYRRNDNGTRKLLYAQSMTEYKDTGLTKGKGYIYEIRAYSKTTGALTAYSPKKTVRTIAAPTILTGNTKGKITWDKNAVATSYRVYRAESPTGAKKLLKPVTTTYYTDTTAEKGKTYYYFVAAYDNSTGTLSAYSNMKAIKIA